MSVSSFDAVVSLGGYPVPTAFSNNLDVFVDVVFGRYWRALGETFTMSRLEDEWVELGSRLVGAIQGDGQPYEDYCRECGCTSVRWRT